MSERNLRLELYSDRPLAHAYFFPHRHTVPDAPFHRELIRGLHSGMPNWQAAIFRGGAKSTYAEEDLILDALFGDFWNCIVIRASETRAKETISVIKNELVMNDRLRHVFGPQQGPVWQEAQIILRNGRRILGMGRNQSLRGTKNPYSNRRPDRVLIDDLEDRENVDTPEGREACMKWLLSELLPACAKERKVRVLYTPMDERSVPEILRREVKWPTLRVPVETVDANGARVPSWPAAYSLDEIDAMREPYEKTGNMTVWEQEYKVNAVAEQDRTFHASYRKIEPRVRSWEAVYCMVDPARSVGVKAANTGIAVWSWVQRRLVIWEAQAKQLMPDEIVDDVFRLADTYNPVWLGVEKTGLVEWLMQPIRARQVQRGQVIPVKAIDAPRMDKMEFIRGLQPYFRNGEVSWVQDFPDLYNEMMSFSPGSKKDVLNALAYAPRLAPGMPVYDEFSASLIVEEAWLDPVRPIWLAANAEGAWVSGVLAQIIDGRLRVFADFVREGDADEAVEMVADAQLEAGRMVRISLGPTHFETWAPSGFARALRASGIRPTRATEAETGRGWLRRALQRQIHGQPSVEIARAARWTLNALAGGYARRLTARGLLSPEPEPGVYSCVMGGLESLCGLVELRADIDDQDQALNWQVTADGRRYVSLLPGTSRPMTKDRA